MYTIRIFYIFGRVDDEGKKLRLKSAGVHSFSWPPFAGVGLNSYAASYVFFLRRVFLISAGWLPPVLKHCCTCSLVLELPTLNVIKK